MCFIEDLSRKYMLVAGDSSTLMMSPGFRVVYADEYHKRRLLRDAGNGKLVEYRFLCEKPCNNCGFFRDGRCRNIEINPAVSRMVWVDRSVSKIPLVVSGIQSTNPQVPVGLLSN